VVFGDEPGVREGSEEFGLRHVSTVEGEPRASSIATAGGCPPTSGKVYTQTPKGLITYCRRICFIRRFSLSAGDRKIPTGGIHQQPCDFEPKAVRGILIIARHWKPKNHKAL